MSRKCDSVGCKNKAGSRRLCNTCAGRKYKNKHPYRYTYQALKDNAKRRGIEFTLTYEFWIKWCDKNNYLNLRGRGLQDMTVDRKKPELGYADGNLQMLTNEENIKKRDADKKLIWDMKYKPLVIDETKPEKIDPDVVPF